MNEYDYLVLLTLAYSSCFSFALREEEVMDRLPLAPKKLLFSKEKIKLSLKKLMRRSLVQQDGEYYFLDKKDLLSRKKRAKFIKEKELRVKEFVELAGKVPFVKAVVLTGSTAVGNAQRDDDLDFMIICRRNTLWLCRFALIILTKLKDKRPSLGTKNAWCFNLWLDEGDLTIDEGRRSLYEAYEILQMKFVFDRNNYEQMFLSANDWLNKYLFFYLRKSDLHKAKIEVTDNSNFYHLFNLVFFWFQKSYRQLIFGKENFSLSLTQAFFNQLNFRGQLFVKLRKKLTDFDMF